MSIDITGLSAKELDALITQAKKRKTTLNKRKPLAAVRRKLTELARAEGYTIAELFGGASAGKAATRPAKAITGARKTTKGYKLGKVAPKYRNPANAGETWAGRGKPPRWLATYLDNGRKIEEFLIR
ncbi:H-NS histone family protein [Lysobacter solisilvae (ex Woo and Kim 2020)]|uniref:H-NS histone family protein n=1 Tax=Agrilutibacter terrestris TaxID=2865112 RepID=A0A7H0FZE1_9GAMM|nr:H-NS histone family protein [Lysobacter terrestris]QNP41407.1 H-NS histone family protein [Lysobacter terrestris]